MRIFRDHALGFDRFRRCPLAVRFSQQNLAGSSVSYLCGARGALRNCGTVGLTYETVGKHT